MPREFQVDVVQQALARHLKSDRALTDLLPTAIEDLGGGPNIFEEPPQGTTYPLVQIGVPTWRPFETMGTDDAPKWGGEMTFVVKVISSYRGDSEAYRIMR